MSASLKVTVVVVCFDALAWIVGVLPTIYYAFTQRALPTLAGIRLMSGPFERLGLDGLILAGLMFVIVSALKLLAAYWLAQAQRQGAVLALILLGLSAIFWYGFALPFGPLVGGLELVLLVLVWGRLH